MMGTGYLPTVNGEPIDAGIYSDTKYEPQEVYKWIKYFAPHLLFPFYTVSADNDLVEDALVPRISKRSGNQYIRNTLPFFVLNQDHGHGFTHRKCTKDAKILPVRYKIKELLGKKKGQRMGKEVLVHQYFGISADEAHRMKPSPDPWIKHYYPLVDAGISRQDCINYMVERGFGEPPRSSCTFCPFHSDKEWLRLKNSAPVEFEEVCVIEERMQHAIETHDTVLRGKMFLHHQRIPLREVRFKGEGQKDLFGQECEGYCGI